MAGLAGYEAGRPKTPTTEDRWYEEQIADAQAKRLKLQREMADTETFTKGLSAEDKARYNANPDLFFKERHLKDLRPGNLETLQRYYGFNDEQLKGLSDADVSALTTKALASRFKSLPKPTSEVELQPDGKYRHVFYDHSGAKIAVGGEARPPKEGDPIKAREAKVLDKFLEHGEASLNPEEKRTINKLLSVTPMQAMGTEFTAGAAPVGTAPGQPDNDPLGIR